MGADGEDGVGHGERREEPGEEERRVFRPLAVGEDREGDRRDPEQNRWDRMDDADHARANDRRRNQQRLREAALPGAASTQEGERREGEGGHREERRALPAEFVAKAGAPEGEELGDGEELLRLRREALDLLQPAGDGVVVNAFKVLEINRHKRHRNDHRRGATDREVALLFRGDRQEEEPNEDDRWERVNREV